MNLLLDGNRGIYIPQQFAEIYGKELVNADEMKEDIEVIAKGPNAENYWEAWENILDNGQFKDQQGNEYTLAQNGDLWAIQKGEELPDYFY